MSKRKTDGRGVRGHRPLSIELDELEKKDPEVRKAAKHYDDTVKDIVSGRAARRHARLQQQLARRQQWRR